MAHFFLAGLVATATECRPAQVSHPHYSSALIGIRESSQITRHYVLLDVEEALTANVGKITRSHLLTCRGLFQDPLLPPL